MKASTAWQMGLLVMGIAGGRCRTSIRVYPRFQYFVSVQERVLVPIASVNIALLTMVGLHQKYLVLMRIEQSTFTRVVGELLSCIHWY